MKNLKINENTTKRDFLKAGGDKKSWKEYEAITTEVKNLNIAVVSLQARANKTADIIKQWSIESEATFNEANSQSVDLILSSCDLSQEEYREKIIFYGMIRE